MQPNGFRTCRDCRVERTKEWRRLNPDYIDVNRNERVKAWQARNPEKAKDYASRWRKQNPELSNQRIREWAKANPEKRQEMKRRRRARELGVATVDMISKQEWMDLKRRFNFRCAYCNKKKALTRDHVIPLSKGGAHALSNIVPACRPCNTKKGTRSSLTQG